MDEKIIHTIQIKSKITQRVITITFLFIMVIIFLSNKEKIFSFENEYISLFFYFLFWAGILVSVYVGYFSATNHLNRINKCILYEKEMHIDGNIKNIVQYKDISGIKIEKNEITFFINTPVLEYEIQPRSVIRSYYKSFGVKVSKTQTNSLTFTNIKNYEETIQRLSEIFPENIFYKNVQKNKFFLPSILELIICAVLFGMIGMLMGNIIANIEESNNIYIYLWSIIGFVLVGEIFFIGINNKKY